MGHSRKLWLGALMVALVGVTPSVVPVGGSVMSASASDCSPASATFPGDGQSGSSGVDYQVLVFTNSSSCDWSVPTGVKQVDLLMIGGGGGGQGLAGGGAGEFLQRSDLAVSGAVSVTAGSGGSGDGGGNSTVGGDSSFGVLEASGGAQGGYNSNGYGSASGASGGGGTRGGYAGGVSTDDSDAETFGSNGAAGAGTGSPVVGGGGGGAGGVPDATVATFGGVKSFGGSGKESTIVPASVATALEVGEVSGESVYFAGGGSGGCGNSGCDNASLTGGIGGGGDGSSAYNPGDGSASTGGGGGGSNTYAGSGGNGGSGVVILRYSLNPGQPTSTSVVSGDGAITLDYTLPSYTGGGTVSLEYQILLASDSSTVKDWTDLGETDGTTTISPAEISNGTLYTVKLRAVNTLPGGSYRSSGVTVGNVIPGPVEEILRLDATHPEYDDETGAGKEWNDQAGSLDADAQGNPTYNARTKAFEFDGTGDYFDLPDIAVDFSNGLALHVTADFGAADEFERLIDFGTGAAGDNIHFGRFGQTDRLQFVVFRGDTQTGWCYDDDAIQPGFHTYSVVIDPDSPTECALYRDGDPLVEDRGTDTNFVPRAVTRTSNLIGRSNWHGLVGVSDVEFSGSIQSVVMYNTDQVTPTCYPVEDSFTGDGTIGEDDVSYKTLQFTTAGDCQWDVPAGISLVDYLVVAGGGGGGHDEGGGGGAGGFRTGTDFSVTAGATVALSVGVGGAGAPDDTPQNGSVTTASSGQDSGFSTVISSGGGAGGDAINDALGGRSGLTGGSGGGGAGENRTTDGGAGNAGAHTPSEGHDGASRASALIGGGGGGAGSAGSGPDGGQGASSTLTGTTVTYAAGGGGGYGNSSTSSAGAPGDASAGRGGDENDAPGVGEANSGSGGGGGGGDAGTNVGNAYAGGDGGSGVVVLRYSLGPGAPAISSVSSGDGSIDVAFTAPSHTGGAAITDYEYSFDGSTWTSLGTASAGTETISGLTNGTAYTVRIRAVSLNGNGVPVTAGSATTPRRAQTLSWSPTNTSVEVKDGSVTLAPAASALGGVSVEYSVQTAGDPSCAIADDSTPTVTFSAAGTCVIRATAVESGAYMAATTDVTLTVSKSSQTITFSSISAKTYGDAAFAVTVSSNSALTVTVTPADTSICTVASTTVTIVSVGTCSLTAAQAGDSEYDAAADVTRTFTISPKAITMSVAISDKTYDGLSAAAVSGTPTLNGLVAGDSGYVAVDTGEITAAFANPDAGSSKAVSVTLGDDVLTGDRASRYTVTVSNSPTATISKADQSSLSITSANAMVFGQAIPVVAVGGSGSGDLSYSKVSGPCTVSDSTVTSTGAGSCVITATREADTNYNSATSSNFTITISKANQSINFTSTVPVSAVSGTRYTPTATASSGLTVSFSITTGDGTVCSLSSGVVTFAQSGTCVITASQAGDSDYNAASSVTQTIVAGKINQTITFPSISGKDFDDAAFSAGASVSSGRSVTYATSTGSVCAVTSSTGVVSIKTVGECTVTASSAGDASYAAASDVSRTFTISPVLAGKPSVTSVSFGDSSVTVAFVAPGFVGGDAIDGYQVVATSSGGSVTKPDCSTTSPCTITGLTNGDAYTLTVAAINAAGVGPVSAASPSITPARVADAVSGLATTPGDEELDVSWAALTTDQVTAAGGTFTRYDVYLRVNGGSWGSAVTPDGTNNLATRTTNSYTFTGLTNGTAYDVKVVAITNANSSELSSNTATALGVPATVPDAPTDLAVVAQSNTTALASWSAPLDDGGAAVTAYSVNLSCTFVNATDTFCELSGLTAGSTVTVTVGATNLMGTGSSVSVSVTMPGGSSGRSGGGSPGSQAVVAATDVPVVAPRRVIVPVQPTPLPRLLASPVRIIPERGFDPSAGAKARVGGQPATVTKKPLGDGGLSVEVGAFQLGIKLSTPGSSELSGAGQRSDIDVPTGQSTKVSGGGLLPGSSLQVWLPGMTGESPRELARIPVQSDGSFASDLSFTSRQSETPIPIGPQVMQVTGYDEQGNQTIVDMVVNIGQGAPAPEPNRSVNELPDLSPGQSLATSAGTPETVTVEATPQTGEVAVLSDEWAFTVTVAEDSGGVEQVDSGATITMVQTKTASVSGEGFQPETRVDIWLFSDPTLLGSVIVAADGSFTGEVYLDARFAVAGEHTLQLQGVAEDGFIKAANLGVMVQEPVELTAGSATGLLWWVAYGLVAVLFLVVLFFAVRRRSRRSAN